MEKNCFSRFIYCLVWSVGLVSLLFLGCSEKSTKDNGTVVTIKSLSVIPSEVQKGQTAVVDVAVEDDADRPVSGAQVAFSVTPGTIGYCTPLVDTTDANGSAAAIFTATDLGTATIQVNVAGVASRTIQVDIVTSGGAAKPLQIQLTPSWLPADGISSSQITVTVKDSLGNTAPNGTVVKFAAGEKFEDADQDGYYTTGIDELKF
ncbi:MAG: invasin domain 3-containing protein, partial [Candidatus Zixiibacteriota bacterium]